MKGKNFIIFFLVAILFFSCSPVEKKNPAEKGYIDLSNWDFDKQGNVDLRGEWEFYWDKFYSPEDFKNQNIEPTHYVKIPSLWNKMQIDSFKIVSDGFATLKLNVKIDNKKEILSLRIGRVETAYKLFVNGNLVKQVGVPGMSKETSLPSWERDNVIFFCDTNELEIILQISNFHHKKIGTSGSIMLGNVKTVTQSSNKVNYFNVFLIGVLLIVALYHFGIFILRKEDKASLLFAIFSINIAIVTFFYGDILFGKVFSWISWKISVNILFLSYFTAMFSFTLFIYNVFKKHFNKKIISGLVIIQLIFSVITIFTPVKIFSHIMMYFQLSAVISLLYLLVGITIAAFKKEEGAFFSALALVIFIGTAVNDILLDALLIKSIYLLSLGTFTFVFLQSFTISLRFSRLFAANKNLTKELNDANKNLEEKVEQRTAKIEQQKEELRVQTENLQEINHEINQQKEELQTQSEVLEKAFLEISAKNNKIEKQNQDITNSIIYARRIQQALLPAEKMFVNNFAEHFIFYKPKNIVSGDFYWTTKINNILLFAVADCTGHGVPGAFVSMLGISLLNEIVRKNEINSTNIVLDIFRKQLKTALKQNADMSELQDGMDMTFCSLNLDTKILEFSGANNPMYIIRKNTPENFINTNEKKNIETNQEKLFHIIPDKQPIGNYFIEKDFSKQTIQLTKGDEIVMLTDGFHDQFGHIEYRKYYSRNLKELFISIYKKTLDEQKQILEEEFINWKGENKQIDDVLVIGLKL
ncbi:MAG: SpoIIE family protein phosphatase [Bacteroidales bacterium]|nr:SpoIIE family protein phosphatase [Bacteroidales bacterium]